MNVTKGPVQTGLKSFATSYPCQSNTLTSFRSVGHFYVNGIAKGTSTPSSPEPFFCR